MYPTITKMSVAMSNRLSPAPIVTRSLSPHDTSPNSRFATTLSMGLKNERSVKRGGEGREGNRKGDNKPG